MYAAPPEIAAAVFATIPPFLTYETQASEFVEIQLHGAATPSLIEGPAFDRDGNLWIVDIPWGRIFRIDRHGAATLIVQYDGEPNGLAFHADGRLFIADYKNGIMVLDPATSAVTRVFDRPMLERFKGVNDLVFAANGDLYFTDQGQTGLHDPTGRLFRLRPDRQLDCVLERVPSPNGLVFGADERTLFLAATRDNAVWRVPLTASGTATKVGKFVQLSGGSGPDGLAIDSKGNLAVAHVGAGSVWLFNPVGEPILRIRSPLGLLTTNCAYGGEGRRSLFITESKTGTILRADMPEPGAMTVYEAAIARL